jgi:hypothetical protein
LSGDNILYYFKSNSLSREVLLSEFEIGSQKTVADVYLDVYNLRKGWEKNEILKGIKFHPLSINKPYTRIQDSILQNITESILTNKFTVSKTDKKAGIIEVSSTMENEKLAKVYCERIVNEAVIKYISIKIQRQKSTVDKLQNRVDSIAKLLNQKTVSSATLQTSASTMDINPLYKAKTVVATESTSRDKTMLATIFASVVQNLELAKFTLSQETPVIQVVDGPMYPLKKIKMSKLFTAILISFLFSSIFIVVIGLNHKNPKDNSKS